VRDPVPQAILRRLDEEEHIGRLMYLWKEVLGYGLAPDTMTHDLLVRTCIRKRHPDIAVRVLTDMSNQNAAVHQSQWPVPLLTTLHLLQSLVSQNLLPLVSQLYTSARSLHGFDEILSYPDTATTQLDLTELKTPKVTAIVLALFATDWLENLKLAGQKAVKDENKKVLEESSLEIQVMNCHAVLDKLDVVNPIVRALFVMEDVQRLGLDHRDGVLCVNPQRLIKHWQDHA
jgi:hypothetical protein